MNKEFIDKLEEGMYVRFEGMINKILEIEEDYINFDMNWYDHWNDEVSSMRIDRFIKDYEPKASKKIIDLIEYKDLLVIENQVKDINNKELYFFNPVRCDGFTTFESNQHCMIINLDYIVPIDNIKIYKILTHEQFEQMSYKVGE